MADRDSLTSDGVAKNRRLPVMHVADCVVTDDDGKGYVHSYAGKVYYGPDWRPWYKVGRSWCVVPLCGVLNVKRRQRLGGSIRVEIK